MTETFTYGAPGGRLKTKTTAVSDGLTFTDKYDYDARGDLDEIQYPRCLNCAFTPPRAVESVFTAGLLTGVTGYTKTMRYHPNGVLSTLRRLNVDATKSDGPLFTQTIDATNKMARPASTSVTGFCDFKITGQPPAQKTSAAGAEAAITITAPGATSYEWYVLGSTQKIAGQTTDTLRIPVMETTSFWARVGNGTCTVDSSVTTIIVEACTPPDATISAPSSIGPAAEAQATVAGDGTYSWSIQNGTIVSAENTKTVTFRAACSGHVSLSVSVASDCGEPVSGSASVAVAAPAVTVSAFPTTIRQRETSSITARVHAGATWTINWSDNLVQTTSGGSASRSEAPVQTTMYSVTRLNGCGGAYGSATLTVTPPEPVAMTATKAGGGIHLAWSMPAGSIVDSFIVERCTFHCTSASATWDTAGSSPTVAYVDGNVAAGLAYAYRVRAIKGGTLSTPSPIDFATNVAFTDDPLVSGTILKLVHLSELRTAVNALRTAAGLAPQSFTDGASPGLVVRAIHFTELRQALNAARSQFGAPAVLFQPALSAGTPVYAAHVEQLRGGIR